MDLASALSMSDAGVALFDTDGMVVYANDAWRELVSTVPEEELNLVETLLPDGFVIAICLLGRTGIKRAAPTLLAIDAPVKRHLLLAEDSGTNQVVARTMLERAGYDVTCVNDGAAALDTVQVDRFDLVLMDVAMPVMNGLEATAAIRRLPAPLGRIPILALTAQAVGASRRQCLDAGMDEFLSKPFDRNQLIEKIEALLTGTPAARAEGTNSPAPDHRHGSAPAPDVPPPRCTPAVGFEMLSRQILDQLVVDAGTDGARIGIEIYLEEAERRLKDIKHALSVEDYEAIGRQAHSLKSASGTFGLVQLQHHCAKLQDAHEQRRDGEVKALGLSLPDVAEPSLRALSRYFASLPSGSGD